MCDGVTQEGSRGRSCGKAGGSCRPGGGEARAKTRKAPAKRTPAAKKAAAPQVSLTLQYMGKELSQEDMVAAVKAQWTGEEIKTLALYVKPEDQAVYYVVNGEGSGKVDL